jgi:hypothetical protein
MVRKEEGAEGKKEQKEGRRKEAKKEGINGDETNFRKERTASEHPWVTGLSSFRNGKWRYYVLLFVSISAEDERMNIDIFEYWSILNILT